MEMAVGIDFGTTNSTLCLYDGSRYHYVDLEDGRRTIPSLMYVDKQYYPTYGENARSKFLRDNLDRRIKLEKTDLGYIELDFGDNAFSYFDHTGFAPSRTTIDASISAFTDLDLPGFLFASTKRLLGQSIIESVKVFDKNIKLEAVVASIIKNMRVRAESEFSEVTPVATTIGRPVNYDSPTAEKQEECNSHALAAMEKALGHAGVRSYRFFFEPIAPILAHVSETGSISLLNSTL